MVEYEEGDTKEVTAARRLLHCPEKARKDYDPTDRMAAIKVLEEANHCNCMITGLIYIKPDQPP